jgi:hypothetical protein
MNEQWLDDAEEDANNPPRRSDRGPWWEAFGDFVFEWSLPLLLGLGVIYLSWMILVEDNRMKAYLQAAPTQSRVLLERLGTPPQGEIICQRHPEGIRCLAGVGGVPITLVCTDTCRLATP